MKDKDDTPPRKPRKLFGQQKEETDEERDRAVRTESALNVMRAIARQRWWWPGED